MPTGWEADYALGALLKDGVSFDSVWRISVARHNRRLAYMSHYGMVIYEHGKVNPEVDVSQLPPDVQRRLAEELEMDEKVRKEEGQK